MAEDRPLPPDRPVTAKPYHWFMETAVQFYVEDRVYRPRGLRQWLRCIWNADVFFGPVPFLKVVAVVSWVISVVIGVSIG